MHSQCPHCHVPLDDVKSVQGRTRSVKGDDSQTDELELCPSCGESLQSDLVNSETLTEAAVDSPPRQFSHFQLVDVLGRGGFGTVWLAFDVRLQRHVALKLPLRRHGRAASLMHEARTAAKLRHPNIVAVHEVGEFEGQVYIVSEYIQGTNLHQYLRQQKLLPIGRVVEMLIAIASGLHHAHENHVVHRDVKPGNVLVDLQGKPLVTDFGLAKKVDVEESISSKGRIVGTIVYMAPEQAGLDVEGVNHRADLYALGVMMYEMLTGERPFRGDLRAIIQQKLTVEPASLRQLRPAVPLDLETICLKCLQRAPARRYESAEAFRLELERFQRGVPILARPITKIEYAWRWCLRNRSVAALGILFVLSLVIGLISTTFYWSRAVKETARAQRSHYDSQMLLAGYHLERGDTDSIRPIIDRFSDPQYKPMRGFEYNFLRREVNRTRNQITHGREIQSIASSRDGDWFVTVGDDRDLVIWPTNDANPLKRIPSKVGRWNCVDVSHRDNRVAVGAKDGTVYVWRSILSEDSQPSIFKHGVSVSKVAFAADGKRLFTCGEKGALRVWDAESLEMLQELPMGKQGLADFAVSRDGKLAVTVDRAGKIWSWDVDARMILSETETMQKILAVDLGPDAETFVVGTYDSLLAAYRTRSCELLYEHNTEYEMIGDVRFLGNSSVVAVLSSLGVTALFDSNEQHEINWLNTHTSAGALIAPTQNGKTIVVGNKDGTATVVDLSELMQRDVISIGQPIRHVTFIDSNTVVVAVDDGRVMTANVDSGETKTLFEPAKKGMTPLAASANRRWLAYQIGPQTIELASLDGTSADQIQLATDQKFSIWASVSGDWLLVGDRSGKLSGYRITNHDTPHAELAFERTIPDNAIPTAATFSIDQQKVILGTTNKQLWELNLANFQLSLVPLTLDSTATAIGLFEQELIIGVQSGHLLRINPIDGTVQWQIKAHRVGFNELIVLPDESTVVTVGRDESVHLFDAVDGTEKMRVHKHQHQVFSIGLCPGSGKFATAGMDGNIRIWRGTDVSDSKDGTVAR